MGGTVIRDRISTDEMLDYFEKFDATYFKYGYKTDEEVHKDWERYSKIVKYEEANQRAFLTKKNYAEDYANLNLVYDEKNRNQDNIRLLELISNKIINQYINIAGMERLFSETYIEFEWEMHLSADYKKHNMKFYRDHFFHQIRDMYMVLILMEKHDFYKYIKNVLLKQGESKISRFVCRTLDQQEYAIQDSLRALRGDTYNFHARNMIYMASMMAALFHDIGYPEAYYMTTSRHIMDYIANLHELNTGSRSGNIRRIYSLLQNSLLFRVVSYDEIEKRLGSIEPDHGALSAVIFLLHFYENGAIHNLVPYKMAAVELAALAIYNHTNKYEFIDPAKKNCNLFRPCFHQNPISYLLRVCDDLQEWDRIYFVITNKSNPLFCSKCHTPIVGKKKISKVSAAKEEEITYYECNCSEDETEGCFSRLFEGHSQFYYRRIFNVSVCDYIIVNRTKAENGKEKICVSLHYDPYKLLYIAYLNPTYAKYRIKELNAVKRYFENQQELPQIYLDYFVTSNPIHIKVKLLEDYFAVLKKGDGRITAIMKISRKNERADALAVYADELFADCRVLIEHFLDKAFYSDPAKREAMEAYLSEALKLYIRLFLYQTICKINNMKYEADMENFVRERGQRLSEQYKEYPELRCLIEDCFLQFSRMYQTISDFEFYPKGYYEQYKTGSRRSYLYPDKTEYCKRESVGYYYKALIKYFDPVGYRPILHLQNTKKIGYIDAYTDLYLFYLMNKEIREKQE